MSHGPGIAIREVHLGEGAAVASGMWVEVRYTGRCGETTFATTSENDAPFAFRVGAGHVVPGWDSGMIGMRVGGVRVISIAPEAGYGVLGYPPLVPANSHVELEIELLRVWNGA